MRDSLMTMMGKYKRGERTRYWHILKMECDIIVDETHWLVYTNDPESGCDGILAALRADTLDDAYELVDRIIKEAAE